MLGVGVFLLVLHLLLFVLIFHYLLGCFLNPGVGHPFIMPPVEGLVVDVVLIRRLIFFAGGVIVLGQSAGQDHRLEPPPLFLALHVESAIKGAVVGVAEFLKDVFIEFGALALALPLRIDRHYTINY